jgi:hypothetical protein
MSTGLQYEAASNQGNEAGNLKILRELGLKSTSQLTGEDLLACAKYIHNHSANASERERSDKLLEILQRHSSLLHGYINGRHLYQHLGDLRFIQPSQRRSEFPASLPWLEISRSHLLQEEVLVYFYLHIFL